MMMKIIARQIEELEELFVEFRTTDSNPCGGSVYYDEDEETAIPDDSGKPWRVHYADGAEDETFRSCHEAEWAIRAYVEDARKDDE
jgi:hypothetical protein